MKIFLSKLLLIFLIITAFINPAFAQSEIKFTPTSSKKTLLSIDKYTPELYKPTKLIIGQETIVKVKAKPYSRVNIAISFENTGPSFLYGQKLRVGEDFKIIEGTVSENGIAEIPVKLPDDENLRNHNMYIEALVWKEKDFSDIKLAKIIGRNGSEITSNAISIREQPKSYFIPGFGPTIPGMAPNALETFSNIDKIKEGREDEIEHLYDVEYTYRTPAYIRNLHAPDVKK